MTTARVAAPGVLTGNTLPLLQAPFLFLRHGETETNRMGLVAGATDVALNATGILQARAAAQQLRQRGITAIYSSPLQRARATARCVSDVLQLPVTVIAQLAERSWGELEGKPRELRVRDATPPGGEGAQAFAQRTLCGLGTIPGGGLPLIVAHSGTFRALCDHLGIAPSATPVRNSHPLRFIPPPDVGAAWRVEPV
jgi:broad specificity phosphatase PhoE